MMTKQLCGINHYNKSYFDNRHIFTLLKNKQVELEDKMEAYFSHHPLVLWAMILVGVPIGIVFAVGLTTTIFAMILLGLRSLMW